jgi:hypothetical protein
VSDRPLDDRVAELATDPGRTWGLPDALLGIAVAPLSLLLSVLLLAALPDLPTAAAVSGATVVLGLGAALAVRRASRQSGGVERALGLELPLWSDTGRILRWSLLLLVAQALAIAVGSALVPALRDAPVDNSGFLRDQSPLALVALTVAAVLVAPLLEELLFRGLVLRGLMLRTGFWPAALVSSACFGALHATAVGLDGVPIVLATGVFGLGLCVLTRRTGRLGPAIGVHSLRNAIAVASVALGA